MSAKSIEQAAGGLIWRRRTNGTELLVAHRPRYDDWAFPKGKVDQGESLIACALREVEEETGLRCRAGRHLGTSEFSKPGGTTKQVTYWAMEAIGGAFEPNKEVDKVEWVGIAQLSQRLSYALDIDFVAALDPTWTSPPDRLLLTRHAHAGDRSKWKGKKDARRPLSKKGRRQAKRLVELLRPFAIDRVLSSPATRCVETVAELAEDRWLSIEETKSLWEEAGRKRVAKLVDRSRIGTTLLSTHGPIVVKILEQLLGSADMGRLEKGSTWLFDLHGHDVTSSSYLPPPSSARAKT